MGGNKVKVKLIKKSFVKYKVQMTALEFKCNDLKAILGFDCSTVKMAEAKKKN